MPLATVLTRAQVGLDAPQVVCEVHLGGGLSSLSIVGLVETAVKESRDRVRAAIKHSGFDMPDGRIAVNLAPADLPKGGSRFDLAIAVGILAASRQIDMAKLERVEFYGELAFSGALRPVGGLLPALLAAGRLGRCCVVPSGCQAEVGLLKHADARTAGHLASVARHLCGDAQLPVAQPLAESKNAADPLPDLADVIGQPAGRRALEIAAAGGHNLLMVGPPGTGKTMLAQRLPGLLPDLGEEEAIENLLLASLTGGPTRHLLRRPFRSPHHTASAIAIVGGGSQPRPGEISLANHGVLFLDELPEFARNVLEALREPLETGSVSIVRTRQSVRFPARFQLVGAMNPCPCGFAGDPTRQCNCSPEQITRYQRKISGPLLDRLQMRLFIGRGAPRLDERDEAPGECTAVARERIGAAAARQLERGEHPNARLTPREIDAWCRPDPKGRRLLQRAAERFAMSMRGCHDTLRVARTLADLAKQERVREENVAEALALRGEDRAVGGSLPASG